MLRLSTVWFKPVKLSRTTSENTVIFKKTLLLPAGTHTFFFETYAGAFVLAKDQKAEILSSVTDGNFETDTNNDINRTNDEKETSPCLTNNENIIKESSNPLPTFMEVSNSFQKLMKTAKRKIEKVHIGKVVPMEFIPYVSKPIKRYTYLPPEALYILSKANERTSGNSRTAALKDVDFTLNERKKVLFSLCLCVCFSEKLLFYFFCF
eukprot:GHVR01046216.1.p1 GENE.GHVR01046216.1~~GHVR01046216.1.p1  ORF type:complete len:208 (-),score=30.38 GHVR01046216.1:978-1601(-)